ncbi:protein of unknown function DUF11 protein [Halorhabdus tiamatea SARL4B]|uniref:Conserved repeat domain protein n=1 Tax=Halorhabdus tiamatea SARL4B TaxID=1033806 RepID=F7PFC9_9EURY|nr:DUF58 domain-containing protein [Halorhabdus tiamatea]ERJ05759.1 protein of unknown function DUF11 protein [Halorhabdus tiamatea SARL4B]CCQ33917.1 conserved repeat domain protein [Halorhabdus tiamatea SARL4B]
MNERLRRFAVVIGLASLAGGGVAILTGGAGGTSSLTAVLYGGGGVLAGVMALVVYRDWRTASRVEPPAVERTPTPPTPGDAFDRTVAQFDGTGTGYLPDRADIHDRIRELAARVLARKRGTTPEAALAAIDAGDWPPDEATAAFLRNADASVEESLSERARGILSDDGSDFQRLVKRTVATLEAESDLLEDADEGRLVRKADRETDERHTTARLASQLVGGSQVYGVVTAARFRPLIPLGIAFVGLGLFVQDSGVVLTGAVPIGVAALAGLVTPPEADLAVERTVDPLHPDPGDEVTVTTTVRNDGDRTLPDLRLVDGVPEGLTVVEGSPRRGTALRPGESTTIEYTVTARRGAHEFEPLYAVVRDYAGRSARTQLVDAGEDADRSLYCIPALQATPVTVPLFEHASESLGRIPAEGGEGVAFYATREYRSGDPTNRIDWKRLARSPSEELTTIEFREEHAATVAIAIETAGSAYTAAEPDDPTGIERSIAAARRVCGSLLGTGDRVGIASLGPTPVWVSPGTGFDHREHVERTLATDDAFPATPPETDTFSPRWVREFHRRFPAETQILLVSPLTDPTYHFVIHRLRAYGHPVTVLSPDVTTDETVGERFVRLERRHRIESLREAGVRVVDWGSDEELGVALTRAGSRWSA